MSRDVSSNTEALRHRIQLNVAGAASNLEEWIVQQVQPSPGMRILDLGCGTGKQLFVLERLISPAGSLLGVDLSDQAVDEVNRRAQQEKLSHAKAVRASLDHCIDLLQNERFDRIVSTYAIYYAADAKRLLCDLRDLLTNHGQVFACGPGRGTNQEIIDLVNRLSGGDAAAMHPIGDFLSPAAIAEITGYYSRLRTH